MSIEYITRAGVSELVEEKEREMECLSLDVLMLL